MKRIISYILVGAAAILLVLSLQTETSVPRTGEQNEQQVQQEMIAVRLVVEGVAHDVRVPPGSSIYDVMRQAQADQIMEFGGREFSGIGYFVEEINGKRENLKGRHFWIYYVNGQKAKAGISSVFVNNQDIIEWKYEDEI